MAIKTMITKQTKDQWKMTQTVPHVLMVHCVLKNKFKKSKFMTKNFECFKVQKLDFYSLCIPHYLETSNL